jgi:hypothetical protein
VPPAWPRTAGQAGRPDSSKAAYLSGDAYQQYSEFLDKRLVLSQLTGPQHRLLPNDRNVKMKGRCDVDFLKFRVDRSSRIPLPESPLRPSYAYFLELLIGRDPV